MEDIWITDIFGIIAGNLSQLDFISLSQTCKKFNSLALPFIYHSVTFDSNYSQFEDEFKHFNTTFVKTRANLIKFISQCTKYPKQLGNLVHHFTILNIQPEFFDLEVFLLNVGNGNQTIFQIMNLVSLNLKIPLGLKLLGQLFNDQNSRNRISNFSYTMERYNSNKYGEIPMKALPNLISLEIDNIYDLNQYNSLIDSNCKIQDLSLHFKAENEMFNTLGNHVLREIHKCFSSLRKLSLSSLDFNLNDDIKSLLPINNISIGSNMTFLELDNISLSILNAGQSKDNSILNLFFDDVQDIKLERLKLNIIYRLLFNDNIDNTNNDDDYDNDYLAQIFINDKLPPNQLTELDLTIRHNRRSSIRLDKIINTYIKAVLNHRQSLRKLSIEIRDSNNNMLDELNVEHLTNMLCGEWPNLKSLTLQTNFHIMNAIKTKLLCNMVKLENIWILGPNSIPKHFGSGNAYPGIFDKWWRIIHLPKWFIESKPQNHPLKYIKIDDCLFIIDPNKTEIISPKDSIDELFYKMAKVTF